ncbi:MarR family transcriptional regulator [Prosthecochloris sp. N3]|uniref:MarR family transcriptional regulator n=1 Tax=Prosthecochloris ethylica TaxID=2743976 RepID=A0ABR9XTP0_9CHLB|nr:MarR family transcriptional regulator [Prosthecochloris ethylica]MBF0586613.1 MarR family transcriptional regulator [Prosthecochloris ethylica]MBF0637354.1 MarR family transcriptional regulator [Prosthecochloris ethylica]NUK48308.1 MarR family transcriptional regulator [Prosthecochloris ethylica]
MNPDPGHAIDHSSVSLRALRRIIRALDVHSRKLYRECNITSPQILCLHSLAAEEHHTLSSLARELHLGLSTVNGIIDRLELRGLVKRTRSTTDQRKVMIGITDAGQDLLQTVPELMRDLYAQAFSRLPSEEQITLASLLDRLAGHLDPDNPDKGRKPETIESTHDVITNTGTDYQFH